MRQGEFGVHASVCNLPLLAVAAATPVEKIVNETQHIFIFSSHVWWRPLCATVPLLLLVCVKHTSFRPSSTGPSTL